MLLFFSMLVTGDVNGKIMFFDKELKLFNWYEEGAKYGPLFSISFSYCPELSQLLFKGKRFVYFFIYLLTYLLFIYLIN